MHPIVILGAGLAGFGAARELRKLDSDSPLVIVSDDDADNYSKPMLSAALGKGKDAKSLVSATRQQMEDSLSAQIYANTQVSAIDRNACQLRMVNGERLAYGKLVLATGAQPIRLPIEGDGANDVLSINNLRDYVVFRDRLDGCKQIAIMGPGLIGCEFANDLLSVGITSTVVGPDAWPISGLIPEAAGRAVMAALESEGVNWRLGRRVSEIHHAGDGYQLTLDDGTRERADLVLSAVGLKPEVRLAQEAGLAVGRGVKVNKSLESSDPRIFALGDCAEVDGRNLPYVPPILEGSKVLARSLVGEKAEVRYGVMPVSIKISRHPVAVVTPPRDAVGSWRFERQDREGVLGRYLGEGDCLLGFVLTGAAMSEKMRLVRELTSSA